VPLPIQPILGVVGRAFLVEHRGVLTLVDTGGPGSEGRIIRALARIGRRPEDIRQVLLTHCHGDHAGTAAALNLRHGTPVTVGDLDAEVVAGREPYPYPPSSLGRGTYGWISRYRRVEPTHRVEGRTSVEGGLELVPAPGHTDGHMAVWAPDLRALFLGDSVWQLGPLRPSWRMFTRDYERKVESIRELADLPSEALLLGHGSPVRRDGRARLRSLVRAVGLTPT
jgi:glyoxylase-like metal-dependent hydrolase (beta-lactamase superfamily II)